MGERIGPDDVLWRFLQLREQLGAPRRAGRILDRGLVFGDRCAKCSAREEQAKLEEYVRDPRLKTEGVRYRCSKCQEPWPVDVAFLLRNSIQMSSRGNGPLDQMLAALSTYSAILECLDQRQRRVYLLLYLYENVGSYEDVAAEMNRRFPRSFPQQSARGPRPSSWTPWAVRQTINTARQKLRGELMRRHLLGSN